MHERHVQMIPNRLRTVLFWGLLGAICILYLLLPVGVPFSARTYANYDEWAFCRMAYAFYSGQWVGPYDSTALIRGPGYPMLIAASGSLGIPFMVTQYALWLGICLLAMRAFRPVCANRAVRLIAFTLLLFAPAVGVLPGTLERESLTTKMAVLLVTSIGAMWIRRDGPVWKVALWGIFAGIGAAGSWLTREEWIWIVLPAALLWAGMIVSMLRRDRARNPLRLAVVALVPVLVTAVPVLAVSATNYHYFGVFNVVDIKSRPFQDAYGAWMRVGEGFRRPYAPVPREARLAIYRISPASALLQPYLDGPAGPPAARPAPGDDQPDIRGGQMVWFFHDAVVAAAGDGPQGLPLDLLTRIADEVNGACDRGEIPCGTRRSSVAPPIRQEDLPAILSKAGELAATLWQWPQWSPVTVARAGPADRNAKAAEVLQMPLCNREEAYPADTSILPAWKTQILQTTYSAERLLAPVATTLMCVWFLAALFLKGGRYRTACLAILGCILVAIAIRTGLVGIIAAINTPEPNPPKRYMLPTRALTVFGWFVTGMSIWDVWRHRGRPSEPHEQA